MKELYNKYQFEKDDFLGYEYKKYLDKLNLIWHVKIEKPTRRCNFYAIYTRFETEDKNLLEKINKIISCNTWSGKCNRFLYNINEIDNFFNSVVKSF